MRNRSRSAGDKAQCFSFGLFTDVPELFDGDVIILPDERFDYGEHRFIVIGILKNQVLVVAYTERGNNIRIISARKATKNE